MQLISTFDKGIPFLLCVIDICSKYAWAIPLKDKKSITTTNTFQKILNLSLAASQIKYVLIKSVNFIIAVYISRNTFQFPGICRESPAFMK